MRNFSSRVEKYFTSERSEWVKYFFNMRREISYLQAWHVIGSLHKEEALLIFSGKEVGLARSLLDKQHEFTGISPLYGQNPACTPPSHIYSVHTRIQNTFSSFSWLYQRLHTPNRQQATELPSFRINLASERLRLHERDWSLTKKQI